MLISLSIWSGQDTDPTTHIVSREHWSHYPPHYRENFDLAIHVVREFYWYHYPHSQEKILISLSIWSGEITDLTMHLGAVFYNWLSFLTKFQMPDGIWIQDSLLRKCTLCQWTSQVLRMSLVFFHILKLQCNLPLNFKPTESNTYLLLQSQQVQILDRGTIPLASGMTKQKDWKYNYQHISVN